MMTPGDIARVLNQYVELLKDRGHMARRDTDGSFTGEGDHLLWMCETACGFVFTKPDKANRWLGFVQGAFWTLGIRTVEEMKRDNMPPGETFDPKYIDGRKVAAKAPPLGTILNIDGIETEEDLCKLWVTHVYNACNGNKSLAARVLGIDRRSLYRRLEALGMVKSDSKDEEECL